MTVRIITRAEWGARPPTRRFKLVTPTPRLWVHHTASEWHGAAGVRQTQNFHMETKGWDDIAYSFLVDDDGAIFEGRGAGVIGAHTSGDNSTSHAICAMGNLDARKPRDTQLLAIAQLAAHGKQAGWWGDITGGHRNAPGAETACPGRYLYERLGEVRAAAVEHGTLTTDTTPGDDMTPEQANQLGRVHHELVAEQATVREMVAQAAYRTAVLEAKVDRLIAKLGA